MRNNNCWILCGLVFLQAEIHCFAEIGTWKRISGSLTAIANDQGSEFEIPHSWNSGFASDDQGNGYLFGGSKENIRSVSGWNDVVDYLYRVDLESGNVSKIYGNAFRFIPSTLPSKGIPCKIQGSPCKEGPALWFSKFDNSLYTFGGYSNYKKCIGNDLWKFNLSSLEWTWISGDLNCTTNGRKPVYGVKGVFAENNWPGAKLMPAFWKSDAEKRLFLHGGRGAYDDSSLSANANLPNQYWDVGDDVWEFDLTNMRWAWIQGSSFRAPLALSSGPSEILTPGFGVDMTFGSDSDDNLWILGSGNSDTYWLWKFANEKRRWEPVSEIDTPGSPPFRRLGGIFNYGRNSLILSGGYNVSTGNYRFQDMWMFQKITKTWKLIYGFELSNFVSNLNVSLGVNIPVIGNSSDKMIIPGLIGFSRFTWNRKIYIYGGLVNTFYNPVFQFTACSNNQYLNNFSCTNCPYGKISSDEKTRALDSCDILCDTGSAWNGEVCVNCTAGKFVYNGEFSTCESCLPGYYSSDKHKNPICTACSLGKFSKNPGSTECFSCPSGLFSQVKGLSECFECNRGSFSSSNGSTFCEICQSGKYNENSNSTSCQSCGLNALTSERGSMSKSDCICMSGFYGKPYYDNECRKCNEVKGLSCPQNSSLPRLDQGYFRYPENPGLALECVPSEACLPTDGDTLSTNCANGYTGWICGTCVSMEFYKLGSKCVECPSFVSKFLVYLALFALFIGGIWKFSTLQSFVSIIDFRIILFWVQIFALLPLLSNSWPSELAVFFRYLSFVNLDLDLSSPECSFPIGFWGKYYAKLMIPFVFMAAYLFRWVYESRYKRRSPFSMEILWHKLEFIFILVVSTFFALIFSTLLSPFGCKYQTDGSYVLQNQSSIKCYQDEWMSVHLPLMIIFFLVYIAFYFFILIKVYWRVKGSAKLNILSVEESDGAVRYLTRSYRHSLYWWEIVLILKRMSIIFFGMLSTSSSHSEIYFAMFVILLIFLILDIVAFPYETRSMMRLSLMWNSLALLFFMADGLIFKSTSTNSDVKLAFSILIILIFAVLVILSLVRFYKSKVYKSKHRVFDAKISGFNPENSTLIVECQTDKAVYDAISCEQLLNPQVNVDLKWNAEFSRKTFSSDALNASQIVPSALNFTTTAMEMTRASQSVQIGDRRPRNTTGIHIQF